MVVRPVKIRSRPYACSRLLLRRDGTPRRQAMPLRNRLWAADVLVCPKKSGASHLPLQVNSNIQQARRTHEVDEGFQ
jgi:hypothetical protein